MYQYTNNSAPSNKDGSFHSLPDTYYYSQQQQQQQQNSYWYPQQPMAATSAPILGPSPPLAPTTASHTHTNATANTTTTAASHQSNNNTIHTPPSPPHLTHPTSRPKITTSLWEDEGTVCYQVDAHGICVARRQDNDMINGTKLLNVTGMSRGKRDGILKNEKGRVVVKVGAMHLKGVWVTFSRAKALAIQHNIKDVLHPLFVDDPSIYFYSNPMAPPHANYFIPTNQLYLPQTSGTEEIYAPHRHAQHHPSSLTSASSLSLPSSMNHLPPTRAVPSMAMTQQDYYAYRDSTHPHQQHQQHQQQHQLHTNNGNGSSTLSLQSHPSQQDLPFNNNSNLTSSSSIDHLDQHSLVDYASKGSSSMFSLTVSDSSPATPSQQSLFYDSTLTTVSSSSNSPHSYSLDQQKPQHYSQSHHQHQQKLHRPSVDNTMLELPIAPTLPSNTSLDSSFYYTHPCVSTTSFHDHLPTNTSNATFSDSPSSKSSSSPPSCEFDAQHYQQQQQHHHQATLEFYGSYTPSTQYSMPAQQW